MLTLYHAPKSRSSRMIWLLEELGVPYEIRQVSIFRPMSGEGMPDPANPHPDKRVPALAHDGRLLAESVAIVLYLLDAFPESRLAPPPENPDRAAYLTWLTWYVAEMEPAMFAAMAGELESSPQKKRSHGLVVRRLEGALAGGSFLISEKFSGADFLVSSALAFGRSAFPPSVILDRYVKRCRTRPAALRGLALDDAVGVQGG